jgi:hypothetical protein
MRYVALVCLLAISSGASAGQTANPPKLSLNIMAITSTPSGFHVSVEVKNLGASSITLQLNPAPAGDPRLQSLAVQQWDDKLGWEYVSPCRDVEGEETRTLSPQRGMQDVVPIGDVAHGWSSSVCPRKIQHLGGKIRAVLLCAYNSEREFKKLGGSIARCQQVESPSVDFPK